MTYLSLIAIITTIVSVTTAATDNASVKLPDTETGGRVSAYLVAFNSGDTAAMYNFNTEHMATSTLRRRSHENRAIRYRKRFHDMGKLQLSQVIEAGPTSLLAVVKTEHGKLFDSSFEFEVKPPHKLLGVHTTGPFDPNRGSAGQQQINQTIKDTVVNRIADELIRAYTFENVAHAMAKDIRVRLAEGKYDNFDNAFRFARQLTTDLREKCHDIHLRVRPRTPRRRGDGLGSRGRPVPNNHSFVRVEVLPGNVGYIKLDGFSGDFAGQGPAAAAMAFVANTNALIFDLRENSGGSPNMICFLSGYLFDSPVHLNSFDNRLDGVSHTYSEEKIRGERYGQIKPIFVLTSGRTGSAAEEFTYDLKHLKRATIVGEPSGGGAHLVKEYVVNKYFAMWLPFARAVNPITKTNWEGVGVIPHVEVPADQALKKAHQLALESLGQSD